MRIDILTLFPAMFGPLQESMMKRAQNKGLAEIQITNIRDYTTDKHQITDDRLYGGGAGMVMKPEPIFAAVEDCMQKKGKTRVIITSPRGELFTQQKARELREAEQLIFICGHYEGIDQRVEEELATDILSIGDFVLTGGEIPTMAMVESIVRLIPGVLGDEASAEEESFSAGLLEYPQYTRPPEFRGKSVPQPLLNGNHKEIAQYRRQESLKVTLERRPDLLEQAPLTQDDMVYLQKVRQEKEKPYRLYVALLHYPVYNKKKQIINTSLTNLDLHDIARSAVTFGVENYFIVQPGESQRALIGQLIGHWQDGFGGAYNPDRHEAVSCVRLIADLSEALIEIKQKNDAPLYLISTSAKPNDKMMDYPTMRKQMREKGGNYLLLFGTGWGLTDEMIASCDFHLRPIYGQGPYNHLSVRSAAAIILDRLQGENFSRQPLPW